MKKIAIPFKNLTYEAKLNLFFAGLVTFYALLVGQELMYKNICGGLSYDFCAYWSGGRIMNEQGYRYIYDADILLSIQRGIYPQAIKAPDIFEEVPLPYLPFFLVTFQLFSLIDLPFSYLTWSVLNIIVFSLYLKFFYKEIHAETIKSQLLLIMMLSLPVFLNLYYGQLNIWLGICTGEFIRAIFYKKPVKAGIWLGGLLLKPQLLIFLLPFLLLKRELKVIAGFLISSIGIGLISWVLIGREGFLDLFGLIVSSSQGGAASNPQAMMNFRMVGTFVEYFVNETFGKILVAVCSAITALVFFLSFSRQQKLDKSSIGFTSLGVMAATCAVTWHAHIHMSIVLIPPLLFLIHDHAVERTVKYWFILFPTILFIVYLVAGLVGAGLVPRTVIPFFDLFLGMVGLVFNLIFLRIASVGAGRINQNILDNSQHLSA